MKRKLLAVFVLMLILTCALASCAEEAPKEHVHAFSDWRIGENATCTQNGHYVRTCECGELETRAIVSIGHVFGEWQQVSESTCAVAGVEKRVCACGEEETNSLPLTEHTVMTNQAVAATCTTDGLTEGTSCANCGTVFEAQEVIPALNHNIVVDPAVEATCKNAGKTEGSHCDRCLDIFVVQNEIPKKTEHTWVVDPAVTETCANVGYTEGSHCKICGEIQVAQQTIPALPHTPVEFDAVAPNCTESGLSAGSRCTVCKNYIVAQTTVPALGHDFGMTNNECSRCATKEYPEVDSRNELTEYDGKGDAVVYLDKCVTVTNTTEYWTLTIHPDTNYVRLVGTADVVYNMCLIVETGRESNLKIDLVNVTLTAITDVPVIDVKDAHDVEVGFYGTTCRLIGKTGANGANAALLKLTYHGEAGKNGNVAIKSNGAIKLTVAADYIEIFGGNGGKGGKGRDADLTPQDGGNGGKGGKGAYAINASSIDIYGKNGHAASSINLFGGEGGNGGAGGEGFPFFSDGKTGAKGESSVATTIQPTYH